MIGSDTISRGYKSDTEFPSLFSPSIAALSSLMPSPEVGRNVDCFVRTIKAEYNVSGLGCGQESTTYGLTDSFEEEDMSAAVIQAEAETEAQTETEIEPKTIIMSASINNTKTVLVGGGPDRREALKQLGDVPKKLLAHGRWLNSDVIDAIMPMVASSTESALYIPAQSIISALDGKVVGPLKAKAKAKAKARARATSTDTTASTATVTVAGDVVAVDGTDMDAGDRHGRLLSAALSLLATNTVLVVPNTGPPGHRGKHWVALRVDLAAQQVHLDDSCPSPQHVQLGALFRDALISGHLANRVSQQQHDQQQQSSSDGSSQCEWPVIPNIDFPQQANGDDCGVYALAAQVYSACGRPWPSRAVCTFIPSLWRAFFFAWTQGISMSDPACRACFGPSETRALFGPVPDQGGDKQGDKQDDNKQDDKQGDTASASASAPSRPSSPPSPTPHISHPSASVIVADLLRRAAVHTANLSRACKEVRAMADQAVELAEVADILIRGSRDMASSQKTDSLVAAGCAAREEKLVTVRELTKNNFLCMISREHLAALETQITACAAAAGRFFTRRAAAATTSATLLGCVRARDMAAHLVSRADDLDSQVDKIRSEWVTASQVVFDAVS